MSYNMVVIAAVAILFVAVAVGIFLSFTLDVRRRQETTHSPDFVKARKFAGSDYDIDEIKPVCVNFDL